VLACDIPAGRKSVVFLGHSVVQTKDKEKWEKILKVEVMSSDKSFSESEDNFIMKVL